MDFDLLFNHVLKNPNSYPGNHQKPNFSKKAGKELDSLAQLHIIINEMINNIHMNLLQGKSIFLKSK